MKVLYIAIASLFAAAHTTMAQVNPVNLDPASLAERCVPRPADDKVARAGEPGEVMSRGCFSRTRLLTPAEAESYFGGGFQVGQVIALSVLADQATLYSDLASDNVWFAGLLGYARMGVGALVGAAEDTTDSSVQQFFEAGGNAVAYMTVPLWTWVNTVGLTTDKNNPARVIRRWDSSLSLAVRGDIPQMNAAVTEPALNGFVGGRMGFVWTTARDILQLHIGTTGGLVVGSESFMVNLGRPEGPRAFASWQFETGIDINRLVRIGLARGGSGLGGVSTPWRLNVQMLSSGSDNR